jgi:hypothetical protein
MSKQVILWRVYLQMFSSGRRLGERCGHVICGFQFLFLFILDITLHQLSDGKPEMAASWVGVSSVDSGFGDTMRLATPIRKPKKNRQLGMDIFSSKNYGQSESVLNPYGKPS